MMISGTGMVSMISSTATTGFGMVCTTSWTMKLGLEMISAVHAGGGREAGKEAVGGREDGKAGGR